MLNCSSGAWTGDNAALFYQRMDETIKPAIRRLIHALSEAHFTVAEIQRIFRAAEDEAARYFQYDIGAITDNVPISSNRDDLRSIRPKRRNSSSPTNAFQQTDEGSEYARDYEILPDWLRGNDTDPSNATQRRFMEILLTLADFGGVVRNFPVSSSLMNHYLGGTGTDVYFLPQWAWNNEGFMGGFDSFLTRANNLLISDLASTLFNNNVILPAYPPLTLPVDWVFNSRFSGEAENGLGTVTVSATRLPFSNNQFAEATIDFEVDPTRNVIVATVYQRVEMYDRYDWSSSGPIAYNPTTDTVVIPGTDRYPPLEIDQAGQIVNHYPPGTDITSLSQFTTIEYPPDSPNQGEAATLWQNYQAGVVPEQTPAVFGNPDHPNPFRQVDIAIGPQDGFYAGQFHALEANGNAAVFNVYSAWDNVQTFEISYTQNNNSISVNDVQLTSSENSVIPIGLNYQDEYWQNYWESNVFVELNESPYTPFREVEDERH